jgi:hypothetical protein
VAILAIALHTILLAAAAPIAAANALDPFSVICHSGSQIAEPGDTAPKAPGSNPSRACDHCSLCSTTPAASESLVDIVAGTLTPTKLLQLLRPADETRRHSVAGNPTKARGPPLTA